MLSVLVTQTHTQNEGRRKLLEVMDMGWSVGLMDILISKLITLYTLNMYSIVYANHTINKEFVFCFLFFKGMFSFCRKLHVKLG